MSSKSSRTWSSACKQREPAKQPRAQANKLFISQQHTLTIMAGVESPAPAQYTLKPSVGGKQPDGRMPDAPSYKIGSAARATGIYMPAPSIDAQTLALLDARRPRPLPSSRAARGGTAASSSGGCRAVVRGRN